MIEFRVLKTCLCLMLRGAYSEVCAAWIKICWLPARVAVLIQQLSPQSQNVRFGMIL